MKFVPGGLRPPSSAPAAVCQPQFAHRSLPVFSLLTALLLCLLAMLPTRAHAQAAPTPVPAVTDDNFHYDNSWELSGGLSWAAMPNGPAIQTRAQLPGVNVAATQWLLPRWGATADIRANVGLGDTNVNAFTVNSPLFVQAFGSVGPEYRWIRTPAIGISLHTLAGGGYGIFNFHVPGNVQNNQLGNYSNGSTFDLIYGANIDFNTPSGFGVRVSPNVITTNFGGDLRNSFSLTAGMVWRFGKF